MLGVSLAPPQPPYQASVFWKEVGTRMETTHPLDQASFPELLELLPPNLRPMLKPSFPGPAPSHDHISLPSTGLASDTVPQVRGSSNHLTG
ncbi:hypothetical protein SNOG_03160 [Parastagonospora nodorum SN15]|uniref:Uncharacterized protein n=1 Tax=Phaeosphaeria nodorum (strain SN15 / ATCC MYA-4574 / FGSC 10173) TaxID=321614 RepID=Q0UYK4_PHANO|nr:hypothetical protein SNOG_03160 [Parastagonospora nodorum SN15]EAT89891.1 hypothetical protein SNOG_03160 [Parastagonospora nodorum SN15]